jgi:hypothetical protein
VQRGGGEIHDNRILKRHLTGRAHEDAFNPVVRKRERTTLVQFGHGILTEHALSQACDREPLAGLREKRAPIHVQLRYFRWKDYTTMHTSHADRSSSDWFASYSIRE